MNGAINNMSRRIPAVIKKLVLDLWLIGNTYSKIAKVAEIGKGTVSG